MCGPLLFLIYINDLVNGIKSHVKFFADDTSLFSIVKDSDVSALELNQTHSFYPHSVNIWNEIGPTLRRVPALNIFKSNVLKLIRPQKKNVFNIHDPEECIQYS